MTAWRRRSARRWPMRIGKLARPKRIIWADDLPKTRSGKIMRRLLRDIAEGRALGDVTTLRDPAVTAQLKERVEEMGRRRTKGGGRFGGGRCGGPGRAGPAVARGARRGGAWRRGETRRFAKGERARGRSSGQNYLIPSAVSLLARRRTDGLGADLAGRALRDVRAAHATAPSAPSRVTWSHVTRSDAIAGGFEHRLAPSIVLARDSRAVESRAIGLDDQMPSANRKSTSNSPTRCGRARSPTASESRAPRAARASDPPARCAWRRARIRGSSRSAPRRGGRGRAPTAVAAPAHRRGAGRAPRAPPGAGCGRRRRRREVEQRPGGRGDGHSRAAGASSRRRSVAVWTRIPARDAACGVGDVDRAAGVGTRTHSIAAERWLRTAPAPPPAPPRVSEPQTRGPNGRLRTRRDAAGAGGLTVPDSHDRLRRDRSSGAGRSSRPRAGAPRAWRPSRRGVDERDTAGAAAWRQARPMIPSACVVPAPALPVRPDPATHARANSSFAPARRVHSAGRGIEEERSHGDQRADHVRAGRGRAPLAGARALQHRRRRVRPASARQAGDGARALLAARCASSTWGELQDLANQAANVLGRARRAARRPGRGACCRRRPRRRRCSSASGSSGAILLSMSVLYGDDGIRHRLTDSQSKVLVTDAANAPRFDARRWRRTCSCSTSTCSQRACDRVRRRVDTAADDPAQLYYTSGTTGLAKGIVHAHRYLLAHEEFVYCHDVQDGERFHGMGEWAWAAGIVPLLGPWRLGAVQCVLPARGRLRARPASSTSSPATRSRTCSRRRPRCAR